MTMRKSGFLTNLFGAMTAATGPVDAAQLTRVAGRERGMPKRAHRRLPSFVAEALESRQMLAGDHPSLPGSFSPTAGDPLTLDAASPLTNPQRGRALTGANQGVSGTIAAGDDGDFFRFVMPSTPGRATDFVTVLADTETNPNGSNLNSTLDTYVEVYRAATGSDPAGQVTNGYFLVTSGANNGVLSSGSTATPDGWAGFVGTAGTTYYIRVWANPAPLAPGHTVTGNYTLRVDTVTLDYAIDATTPMPDPPAPARDIFGEGDAPGSIAFRQDDIIYRVTTPNDARFDSLATVGAIADDAAELDTHLEVYSNGNTNGVVSTLASDIQAGRLTNAFTTFRGAANTTFYVRVRSDELAAGRPATGAFSLAIDMAALPIAIDQTTRLSSPDRSDAIAPLSGSNAPAGTSSRVYQFTAQGTGISFITVTATPGIPFVGERNPGPPGAYPPLDDPAVTLFSETGAKLAFNDDANGFTPQLQVALTGGQRYFVLVEGFDRAIDGGFSVFIEANYTFNSTDDHIDTTPTNDLNFNNATPIVFGQPFLPTDADGNGRFDANWVQTGTSQGRVYEPGDTDVFQFVPPVNMLSSYAGDDDNMGTALYVGGNFGSADRVNPNNLAAGGRGAPNVAIWDADDWWNAGPGIEDGGLAAGAIDGPIRAFVRWDPDAAGTAFNEVLIAGGQFTFDDDFDPLTPNIPTNLAMRVFIPAQNRFVWQPLQDPFGNFPVFGSLNNRVNALEVFDIDGAGDLPPSLIVGGRFTNVGGVAATNIVEIAFNGFGFDAFNLGVNATGGAAPEVRALAVWDPPQTPDPDGAGPMMQPPDAPLSLVVGGSFTAPGNNVFQFGPVDQMPGTPNTVSLFGTVGNNGTNGAVNALAAYDSPEMNGPDDIPVRMYVGGSFTNRGNNIGAWNNAGVPMGTAPVWDDVGDLPAAVHALTVWEIPTPGGGGDENTFLMAGGGVDGVSGFVQGTQNDAWADLIAGINAPVRALDTFIDEEFDISMGEQLVVGGDFDMIGMNEVGHIFRVTDQNDDDASAILAMKAGVFGLALGSTAPTSVLAIEDFDDDVQGVWDRNDRPLSRVAIVVNPTTDAFLNATIRIYDSNFTEIYFNDTISPFPDPAGSIDPMRTAGPGFNAAFVTPGLWGGEVYYVEVTGGGTGRYTIALSVDAVPAEDPDNLDGQYFDDKSVWTEVPGEGRFDIAPELVLNGSGDGRNLDFITPDPTAFQIHTGNITPSGTRRVASDFLAGIESINDTDLYQFRASATGTVEVRLSTFAITDRATETFFNMHVPLADGVDNTSPTSPFIFNFQQMNSPEATRTYKSPLDGLLRIFNNDFEEIGTNDDSLAVGGFGDTFQSGIYNDLSDGTHSFLQRDPRLVIPVVAGETYFIQVESAYREAFLGIDPLDPSDDKSEHVDWRHALGAYELLINNTQSSNGIDDFENDDGGPLALSTAIPFNTTTGNGTIDGVIDNVPAGTFPNPDDTDLFSYVALNRGSLTVTVTATSPGLAPTVTILDAGGQLAGTGSGGAGGTATASTVVTQGARFYIVVDGQGTTEGTYTVTVDGPGITDDHVKDGDWADATQLELDRFLGQYVAAGFIENPNDSDLFGFRAEEYEIATVTVTSTDVTMNPFVFVWEVSSNATDPMDGLVEYRLVGANDNAPGMGNNASTEFSVTAGKDYYIVVYGTDPNLNFGRYNVAVDVTPTDDHPNLIDFPLATQFDLAATFDPLTFTSSGSINGEIEVNTDNDMFRFIPPASGTATVTVTTPSSGLAADVFVYDANQVLVGTAAGVSGTATVTVNVSSNAQYFVEVRPGTTGAGQPDDIGAYTLSVTTAPVDDYANAGQWASPSVGVITLSNSTGAGTLSGLIVPNTDSDLFRFTTLAIGNVQIRVTTVGSTFNPKIRIYTSTFTEIPGATSNGDTASLTFQATGAGETYFILVLPNDGASGSTAVGNYAVQVVGRTVGGGGGGTDDHANAGEFGDATLIMVDSRTGFGTASGVINFGGDTDLFKFLPAAGGKTGVQIKTPSGGLVDGRVKIYNKNFVLVAEDAAGVPGATANVDFSTTVTSSADVYYILVEPVGTAQGSYTVEVSSQPLTHFLYYPEGFSGATIDEFVPIVNTNDFAVSYQVFVRYESGAQRTTPIATGIINPKSRGGITVSTKSGDSLVDRGRAYALEIQSTGQLGATMSHYDFNVSVGESFTNRLSTTWTFAQLNKDRNNFRDFLVFYNPTNTDANLTIQLIYDDGTIASFQQTVRSLRRGGVNIDADGRVARNGRFGVRITSNVGIVSALSSYNLANNGGDGLLGDADGGTTSGVIPNISSGGGVTSSLSFLNTNAQPATITVTASYARVDLPDLVRVITVQPNRQFTISLSDLGLINSQAAGIKFTSSVPVTGSVFEYQNGDGDATAAATVAAREYVFGDLFVNPAFAGVTYIERLGLYNPSATAIDVNIRFLFTDGTSSDLVVNVPAGDFGFVQIDQATAVLSRGNPTAFSLDVTSQTPIVASLTHYDLFLNGGWSTLGAPIGLTVPISTL